MEPIYRLRLARALRLDGQEKEAREVNRETLKTDPAHPVCHLEMAHLDLKRGKLDKAQEHLDVALTAWAEAGTEYLPAREARQLADRLKAN
jgi:Tfp pilus assembly protein PilF